jgi:hypothetical protein
MTEQLEDPPEIREQGESACGSDTDGCDDDEPIEIFHRRVMRVV